MPNRTYVDLFDDEEYTPRQSVDLSGLIGKSYVGPDTYTKLDEDEGFNSVM